MMHENSFIPCLLVSVCYKMCVVIAPVEHKGLKERGNVCSGLNKDGVFQPRAPSSDRCLQWRQASNKRT